MADQLRNAGNIGDVFQHSLLPVLVAGFDASQSGDWVYCETHAGYYDYPLSLLKDDTSWKGERAWSVGVLHRTNSIDLLADYGSQLADGITSGVYPGSLKSTLVTMKLSGPEASNASVIDERTPVIKAAIETTTETPTDTPRIVSRERSRLVRNASNATRVLSQSV